jgi:hypothetical protein
MRGRNQVQWLVFGCLVVAGLYYLNSGDKPPPAPPPAAFVDWSKWSPTQEIGIIKPVARLLSPEASERQAQEWGAFRRAFPYHIQAIAASEPYSDGTRTLIVSEPPPHATLDGLIAVDPALATAEVRTHTVGHDGWVKDVVFNVQTDPQGLTRLVGGLSKYLFETDYKAYCLKLPTDLDSLQTKYPLDLRVGPAEIKSWMKGSFTSVNGGSAQNLTGFALGLDGVYLSDKPGLVAWGIPAGVSLETRRADARRFALDSDVIVGAVKSMSGDVIVLGRERVAPVDVMPPLRAEMIVLLASAKTDKLSQSYERSAFFAGNFKGPWDWAPAYLSPQLIDTEYGGLLNIADQLLKSWTQHGDVRYQNFPYPDPPRFPFDQPLNQVLDAQSLLFNWNTTGVGFVADGDLPGAQVYGLNRTGALPVIYRPDEAGESIEIIHGDAAQVKGAEEDGYTFFATRNDPCLARVVQYTALYQCFRSFGVTAQAPVSATAGDTKLVIREHLRAALKALVEATDARIDEVVLARVNRLFNVIQNPDLGDPLSTTEADRQKSQTIDALVSDAKALREKLQAFHAVWGDIGLDNAAAATVALRSRDASDESFSPLVGELEGAAIGDLFKDLVAYRQSLNLWADLADVQKRFSTAQGDGNGRWMHTQTVVVSCDVGGSVGLTGGHDVAAKVTPFKTDLLMPRGKVELRDGTIWYNSVDAERFPDLARLAAREKGNPNLPKLLNDRLNAAPPRFVEDPRTALVLGEPVPGEARGFWPERQVPAGGAGKPPPPGGPTDGLPSPHAEPPEKPLPPPPPDTPPRAASAAGDPLEPDRFFSAMPDGVWLQKRGGKVTICRKSASGNQVAEVWNSQNAQYAVLAELQNSGRGGQGRPLKVMFGEGFPEHDAQAFMETLRVQAARYPEVKPILVFHALTPEAAARFSSRVSNVVPKTFEVAVVGRGVRITGGLAVTDAAAQTFGVKVDVRLSTGAEMATPEVVQSTIAATAQRVGAHGQMSVSDLGAEIFQDLRRLSPNQRPTEAVFSVDDAGDFHIILEDDPSRAPPTGGGRNAGTSRIAS